VVGRAADGPGFVQCTAVLLRHPRIRTMASVCVFRPYAGDFGARCSFTKLLRDLSVHRDVIGNWENSGSKVSCVNSESGREHLEE
jgi:hypothetical protein